MPCTCCLGWIAAHSGFHRCHEGDGVLKVLVRCFPGTPSHFTTITLGVLVLGWSEGMLLSEMLRRFLKAILRNWTIRFLNATNEISHLLGRWVRRWCWSDLCWVGDFVRCLSGRLRRGGKSPPTTGTTRRPAIKQPFRTTFRQNILETTPMNTPYEYIEIEQIDLRKTLNKWNIYELKYA